MSTQTVIPLPRYWYSHKTHSKEISENDMRVFSLCQGISACMEIGDINSAMDYLDTLVSLGKHFVVVHEEASA